MPCYLHGMPTFITELLCLVSIVYTIGKTHFTAKQSIVKDEVCIYCTIPNDIVGALMKICHLSHHLVWHAHFIFYSDYVTPL